MTKCQYTKVFRSFHELDTEIKHITQLIRWLISKNYNRTNTSTHILKANCGSIIVRIFIPQ